MNKLNEVLNTVSLSLIIFVIVAIPMHFIYNVWKRQDISTESKLLWMIFLIIAPLISIIIYMAFGYKEPNKS